MKNDEAFNRRKLTVLSSTAWHLREESENRELHLMKLENFLGIKDVPFLKNEVFSEIVSELGDTPQKEQELYKLIKEEDEEGILAFIRAKEGNENLEFDDMDAQEVATLLRAIVYRVTSYKDDNGELKAVEELKDAKVPTRKLAKEIKKLQKELSELEDVEAIKAKDDKIRELLLNASFDKQKIKKIEKDEWLKELLLLKQYTYITDSKTPFGGF